MFKNIFIHVFIILLLTMGNNQLYAPSIVDIAKGLWDALPNGTVKIGGGPSALSSQYWQQQFPNVQTTNGGPISPVPDTPTMAPTSTPSPSPTAIPTVAPTVAPPQASSPNNTNWLSSILGMFNTPQTISYNFNRPIPSSSPTSISLPRTLSSPSPTPSPIPGRYADIWKQEMGNHPNLPAWSSNLIINSENGGQDPNAIHPNDNGTWDVGLTQYNVNPSDSGEVTRLKDPAYNIKKGLNKLDNYTQQAGDPVLGIAAYNMGVNGAVSDPQDALKRAQWVYYKAGINMPQTPFTQDPQGFVSQNMNKYRQLGIIK